MKRFATIIVLLAAFGNLPTVLHAEPLRTEYPKPLMGSGPVPIRLPNLEPPRTYMPWKYDLPPGCTNLALGRLASANDLSVGYETLALITDGIKSAVEDEVVELSAGARWVQIYLGKECAIYAILVWRSCLLPCPYKAVVIQLSNDADFSKGVATIFNNDMDNLNGQGVGKDFTYVETNYGKLFDAKGAKARYLRLWSNGNTKDKLNRYAEVEVWGK